MLQHDTLSRQRNIVFPDTVRNEAEGYRHLLSAPKLSTVERVGAFIEGLFGLVLGLGLGIASFFMPRMVANEVDSRTFGAVMIVPALLMMGVALVFAVLGFRLLKRSIGR